MGLSFTIDADPDPHQGIHSQVRVPQGSWPQFTLSVSRIPQPGGPGPRIYIPQEQGDPVIALGTAFPFRRLLRYARLRWRFSNPPPQGVLSLSTVSHPLKRVFRRLSTEWLCPSLVTFQHGTQKITRIHCYSPTVPLLKLCCLAMWKCL
jgi:hypothetical protein